MIDQGVHPILGVGIHAVDYETAVERILNAAHARRPFGVSALAVHGVMTGYLDTMHRRRLNALDLVVPDGQPVRWGLRWCHDIDLPDRVYGPELTLKLLNAASETHLPVFFYGSTRCTLERLRQRVTMRFPDLRIAGMEPSKFRKITPEEKNKLIARIRSTGARIVLVGLGCPRQEVWVYEYRPFLQMPLVAVGAAFDFHAGILPQAPRWMQDHGLEWLFRLAQEPTRLWRRTLLYPRYLAAVWLQALTTFSPERLRPDGRVPELSYG